MQIAYYECVTYSKVKCNKGFSMYDAMLYTLLKSNNVESYMTDRLPQSIKPVTDHQLVTSEGI
jgi:hypothetical protein